MIHKKRGDVNAGRNETGLKKGLVEPQKRKTQTEKESLLLLIDGYLFNHMGG